MSSICFHKGPKPFMCVCVVELVLQFRCKLKLYCWILQSAVGDKLLTVLLHFLFISLASFAACTGEGGDLCLHLSLSVP